MIDGSNTTTATTHAWVTKCIQTRVKTILYQHYNIAIEIAEKNTVLKQGNPTLTQQGDALCMVHCDIYSYTWISIQTHQKLYANKHIALLSSLMIMQYTFKQQCVHEYASRIHHILHKNPVKLATETMSTYIPTIGASVYIDTIIQVQQ